MIYLLSLSDCMWCWYQFTVVKSCVLFSAVFLLVFAKTIQVVSDVGITSRGDGMAQWLECWTWDLKIEGSNPVRSTRKTSFFPSQKGCADSLSVCPTYVCIRTHTENHVRTLKILYSVSELGGLSKHENNQHALVPPITNGHIRYPSYGGTQITVHWSIHDFSVLPQPHKRKQAQQINFVKWRH